MNKIVITVPEEADGARADKFLAEAIDHLTRSALQKLISAGNDEIDGKVIFEGGGDHLIGNFAKVLIEDSDEYDLKGRLV